MYTDNLTRA